MSVYAGFRETAALTPAEIERYLTRGQVTPQWRLPTAVLSRMQDALERLLRARQDIRPDFIALPHLPWNGDEGMEIAREFFDFVTDPDLLDLVSAVIGPDLILWASSVFCKPPGVGLEVPWHQDGQYWPIRPRATVTVWIALDDVTPENGCMRVIPGSHRLGDFTHEVSARDDLVLSNVLNDPRIDLASAYDVIMTAGELSLHDVDIVHGSQPNRSPRRRAGFAIRYMPSTAHYDRSLQLGNASATVPVEFAQRPIWLVRGVDRCGRNDFDIGHTYW